MKLGRALQAVVIAGAFAGATGCSSAEPEVSQETTADELRLGFDLGSAELKVALETKHMMMNVSGFELGVQVCAPGATAAPGTTPCELSVSLLGARAWLDSVSWEQVKFAGVLPLRLDNLPLLFDGSVNRTDVGLGEGRCVFDESTSRPEVKTKAIPFEVIIESKPQEPAAGAPQEDRTLADMVLDHMTVKLALTRADFHSCVQGCFDATADDPAASCTAQDDQMSGLLAGVLAGDLAELVRPMLREALARRTGR